MKILHTSDWHLGKIIYNRSMLEDQRYFIHQFFLPLVDRERPDAIMIAGDIFDRQIAPAEAIRLFDSFVEEICITRKIKLLVSLGNHDGNDRFSLGAPLLRESGFYIAARLDLSGAPVTLEADGGLADVYMLPYVDPPMARDVLGDDSVKSFTDAYRAALAPIREKLREDRLNLLMAHCFVTGSQTSDSENPIYIGGGGEIDGSLFQGFDYVALGHLHMPQPAGRNARYSGSPLCYSFDERPDKAVIMLDMEEGEMQVRTIPVEPLRRMRTISGTIEEVEDRAKSDPAREDFILADLQGPPIFEPMARLRKIYPNTLNLHNGTVHSQFDDAGRQELKDQLKKGRSDDLFVFSEFYRQMCGEPAGEADLEIFKEALAAFDSKKQGEPSV